MIFATDLLDSLIPDMAEIMRFISAAPCSAMVLDSPARIRAWEAFSAFARVWDPISVMAEVICSIAAACLAALWERD